MKFREQKELVANLRAFADFLEQPKSAALPSLLVKADAWRYSKEDMTRAAKAMSPCEKVYANYGPYFDLVRRFGSVKLEITCHRNLVCRKVVKATKLVEEEVPTAFETRLVKKEEVEWVCDEPLLRT